MYDTHAMGKDCACLCVQTRVSSDILAKHEYADKIDDFRNITDLVRINAIFLHLSNDNDYGKQHRHSSSLTSSVN